MRRTPLILIALVLAMAGCATRPSVSKAVKSARPATAPEAHDPRSQLALEQIEPVPLLPAPATRPTSQPSLDAIHLFARARSAALSNQRQTAVNLLEQAVRLDPYSFALRRALAEAYAALNIHSDRAIQALRQASDLDPADLQTRLDLGRLYLARGDSSAAVEQLRLALLSPDYATDDANAALVDYLLARALQQGGYDRAALDRYGLLLQRLQSPSLRVRGNPELAYWLSRPELLYADVAALYEKLGRLDEALEAYQIVARGNPEMFESHARVVRVLAKLGRRDRGRAEEARATAADVVRRFRASPDSVALLREVYGTLGDASDAVSELRELWQDRPADRSIVLALVELLDQSGESRHAETILWQAVRQGDADWELIGRLFDRLAARDATADAARLLVESTSRDPALTRQLTPLWVELVRPSRRNQVRPADLQAMDVAGGDGARHYWIARLASLAGREELARASLDAAASADPVFPPAQRLRLDQILSRGDWDAAKKQAETDALIESLRRRGAEALAEELRATALLARGKAEESATAFASAEQLARARGCAGPDLILGHAAALKSKGDHVGFERQMWRLLSDYPGLPDGYVLLFTHYLSDAKNANRAVNVLQAWTQADPQSRAGRIFRAEVLTNTGAGADAEAVLAELLKQRPGDPEVLQAVRRLRAQQGKLQDWIKQLEDLRTADPHNLAVVEQLVEIYAEQKRLAEAWRVLDATRSAITDDADLLYYLAHLYTLAEQKDAAEQLMQQVLKLEPRHVSASNDLGYNWADAGRNLARAETLVRQAVQAEPDNASFLDSLGWVLYKRGRFEEARQFLRQAIGDEGPDDDPVVLDHLADVLWQLGDHDEAKRLWQRSLQRLGQSDDARPDLRGLRLQLQTKLKQAESGAPVSVAPVVEPPASRPVQASKREARSP